MKRIKCVATVIASLLAASLIVCGGLAIPAAAATATIAVSGTQWGQSTCYLGANEGSADFDIADMQDLGINTYRIYGGFSRWEWQDDDGVFGSPSIAEIEADPDVINWTWWNDAFTNPPDGSDYHWASYTVVQKSAADIFGELKAAGIKPVVVIRNVDDQSQPDWSNNGLNPPSNPEGWNEWWEHVFATAYWLNVLNDYQVDDWEVHNEPNFSGQGWGGTEDDYWELVRQMNDALQYVYATYLPGRTPNVYAPVSGMGNNWTSAMPERALQNVPNDFNMMDVHDYEADISSYVQQVHGWMTQYGYPKPLWITEWGEYPHKGIKIPYSWDASSGVERIVENMIRGSQPGDDYVYGSHIFSLYDWGTGYLSGLIAHDGSIRSNGYYPFRLAARALQGCRTTYESTSSTGDLMAITTQDASGDVYLLVANSSRNDHTVDADLSALLTSGTGTMWRYDANTLDQIVGNPTLSSGHVTFDIPSNSAIVIQFGGGTPPPPTDTPMPTDTPDPPPTDTPEPPPTDTPEPTATPTEGPSPTPTDTPIPTDTPEPTPTNTPGGGTVMHVEDIYTTDASGNPQDVFAPKDVVYYQVQILDQSSGPVDSASVTTDLFWPDDTLLTTLTSTSGADGWAYFSKRTNPNYPLGTYTIEVANVTKEGATYDPNANVKDVHQFMLQ